MLISTSVDICDVEVEVDVDPYEALDDLSDDEIISYLRTNRKNDVYDHDILDDYQSLAYKTIRHEFDIVKLIEEIGIDTINKELEFKHSNLRLTKNDG